MILVTLFKVVRNLKTGKNEVKPTNRDALQKAWERKGEVPRAYNSRTWDQLRDPRETWYRKRFVLIFIIFFKKHGEFKWLRELYVEDRPGSRSNCSKNG